MTMGACEGHRGVVYAVGSTSVALEHLLHVDVREFINVVTSTEGKVTHAASVVVLGKQKALHSSRILEAIRH